MKKVTIALQNKDRPELGWVEIELPADEEMLNAALNEIDIPYASPERNCVFTIPNYEETPFDCIKGKIVNADELNYLAMRLDSFTHHDMTAFQAAAVCENISDVETLINLTFNTSNYTVITDLSDPAAIGGKYYLDEHIAVPLSDFDKINAVEIGNNLLQSGNGIVTKFGVVFKHGKEPEIAYNGKTFPQYEYIGETVISIGLISSFEPDDTDEIVWLDLPVADSCIEKAVQRLGVYSIDNVQIQYIDPINIPDSILQRVNTEKETIYSFNDFCRAMHNMNYDDQDKLNAVCDFIDAQSFHSITFAANNIQYFKFAPGVQNSEQYGKYLIKQSGAYMYDKNLSDYYDYESFGKAKMNNEYGRFTEKGYTVFIGLPEVLDELLKQEQNNGITMS